MGVGQRVKQKSKGGALHHPPLRIVGSKFLLLPISNPKNMFRHQPVMLREVVQLLAPKKNQNFIDATLGLGGHAQALLEKTGPQGKLLGIDWDREMLEVSRQNLEIFGKRVILVNDNFVYLDEIVSEQGFRDIAGILFDLGLASPQIDNASRGFSFQKDGPLDMRMGNQNKTAADIVNQSTPQELERIFRQYGEERYSRLVAKTIVQTRRQRKIKRTLELVEIIKSAVPEYSQHGRIHPATRVFQALRIAIGDELNNLSFALPRAFDTIAVGGRIIVISFHSLEDRIVKNYFRDLSSQDKGKILTKKPIIPTAEEAKSNPRSRSAKLRVIEKI